MAGCRDTIKRNFPGFKFVRQLPQKLDCLCFINSKRILACSTGTFRSVHLLFISASHLPCYLFRTARERAVASTLAKLKNGFPKQPCTPPNRLRAWHFRKKIRRFLTLQLRHRCAWGDANDAPGFIWLRSKKLIAGPHAD